MRNTLNINLSDEEIEEPRCNPEEFVKLLSKLRFEWREHLVVVPITSGNNALGVEVVSIGTVDHTPASPAEIFKLMFSKRKYLRASGFIIAHNHPSGNLTPSMDDIQLTKIIKGAAQIMQMQFLDHIILSHRGFNSLRRTTDIWGE